METWPALAGEGSLGVETDSVLVAAAGLTFIYVFRHKFKTQDTGHRTQETRHRTQDKRVLL